MRKRLFPRAAALSTAAVLSGLGLAALAPAAGAATPAKPYDFNGDGYRDLAVGSPNGTVGSKKQAGFVTVVYGASSGLNKSKRQILSQDTRGVAGAAETGDHFGHAVASADFDRDGYADLAVSAPDEDSGSLANAGGLTIFWGTRSGLNTNAWTGAFEPGQPSGGRAGLSMTAGDFNGGGNPDLAYSGASFWGWLSFEPGTGARVSRTRPFTPHRMTAPGPRRNARAAAATPMTVLVSQGHVTGSKHANVVLTWKNPAATDPVQREAIVVWEPDGAHSLVPKATVNAETGRPVVGDFDGDRYADVALGQSGDTGHTGGQVTVYKGSAAGITADAKTVLSIEKLKLPGAGAAGNGFGADLAAGDVTRDGRADLAIGVPGYKVSGQPAAGGVFVLFGSAKGLGSHGAEWISQSTSGVPGGSEKNDRFGSGVTLLDHTKDGHADLVVGSSGENGTEGALFGSKGRSYGFRTSSGAVSGASWAPNTFGVGGKVAQYGLILGD
ncbi:VCBS repeat-containing protein [Actinomadura kijaniata]|uniref:VCBS repeat-containing protein n=1 Tax=Actinomadura kijaniata TaxID=46161 RepID=UPI000B1C142E|nr:VCBS repeat-containing protein [Actinomadura kijaniata]